MNRVVTLYACGLLSCLSLLSQADEVQPVQVEVEQVTETEMSNTLWLPGTVISRNDAYISSEQSGRLDSMVDVGTRFSQGDVLARIDDSWLKIQLQRDNAKVDSLSAEVGFLQRKVKRLEKMRRSNNASENELDQAVSDLDVARHNLNAAVADRAMTELYLSRTRVRAPFDGIVVSRSRQPGEYTEVGVRLFRLVNDAALDVRVQAPLSVAPFVAEAMSVDVQDEKGQRQKLSIRTIVPVGEERSRTMEIRLAANLKPYVVGQALRVAIPGSQPNKVLAVHRDALVLRNNKSYLFVVQQDNVVRRIEVTPGLGSGDYIEVKGELNHGDRVVVRGAERLQAGQTVKFNSKLSLASS